jgi:hypothetical protein
MTYGKKHIRVVEKNFFTFSCITPEKSNLIQITMHLLKFGTHCLIFKSGSVQMKIARMRLKKSNKV